MSRRREGPFSNHNPRGRRVNRDGAGHHGLLVLERPEQLFLEPVGPGLPLDPSHHDHADPHHLFTDIHDLRAGLVLDLDHTITILLLFRLDHPHHNNLIGAFPTERVHLGLINHTTDFLYDFDGGGFAPLQVVLEVDRGLLGDCDGQGGADWRQVGVEGRVRDEGF